MGNEDVAVTLLNYGANPNSIYEKKSMLMLCALVKKQKITNIMLMRGADPNFTNKAGSSLHYALLEDNETMFKALFTHEGVKLFLIR